jgi:rsbT co-antagonist protein RsbR
MADDALELPQLIERDQAKIVAHWLELIAARGLPAGTSRAELEQQCREFLAGLSRAISGGIGQDIATAPAFGTVRELLRAIAQARAIQGLSSSDTATFIFSLKQPLFATISGAFPGQTDKVLRASWTINLLLDQLGLQVVENYQKTREEVIVRQQQEIAELSTPVVQLWDGVLALPVIGTLDSGRTQVVMESLLQRIVDTGAAIAIIDITGVITVDTLVAQHLLKTVAAARLMGADCIISGIRPQIAQTLVHLGVELNVVTKASLADALAEALRRTSRAVVTVAPRG